MNLNHPPKVRNFVQRVKEDPTVRDRYIRKLHAWDSKRTDNKLKLCTSCKLVWETYRGTLNNETVEKYYYYNDFPTIGKTRKVCPKCRVLTD